MDSHEEKVFQVVSWSTQEREAKHKMRKKAKELRKQRLEANKKGGIKSLSFNTGYGSGSNSTLFSNVGDSTNYVPEPAKPSYTSMRKLASIRSNVMMLGGKSRDVDIVLLIS